MFGFNKGSGIVSRSDFEGPSTFWKGIEQNLSLTKLYNLGKRNGLSHFQVKVGAPPTCGASSLYPAEFEIHGPHCRVWTLNGAGNFSPAFAETSYSPSASCGHHPQQEAVRFSPVTSPIPLLGAVLCGIGEWLGVGQSKCEMLEGYCMEPGGSA